mgnify:CR=1 FL=1
MMVADIYYNDKVPIGVYFHQYSRDPSKRESCLRKDTEVESCLILKCTDINSSKYSYLSDQEFQFKIIEDMKIQGYEGD